MSKLSREARRHLTDLGVTALGRGASALLYSVRGVAYDGLAHDAQRGGQMDESLLRALDAFADAIGERVASRNVPADYSELHQILTSVDWASPSVEEGAAADAPTSVRIRGRLHHRPPGGSNAPRTQHAGDIVADLLLLAEVPDDDALYLFVYFTDDEMAGYLSNADNRMHRLYDLPRGERYLLEEMFFADRADSFTKRLKGRSGPVRLISLLRRDYPGGYGLRVWQVLHEGQDERLAREGGATSTSSTASAAPSVATTTRAPLSVPEDWRELVAGALCVRIEPDRDENGDVRRYQPQADYDNVEGLPLHRYGRGGFCRFRVPGKVHRAGVYFITVDERLAYVGECEDFSQRFNAGYGQISPRNCYRGGQETNCRVNQFILSCVEGGKIIEVHFLEAEDRHAFERACISAYDPPWNKHM